MAVAAPTRRGLALAIAAARLLVVARSLVFVIYPESYFDSDQAVFGLMAKHLVEGRAFPRAGLTGLTPERFPEVCSTVQAEFAAARLTVS